MKKISLALRSIALVLIAALLLSACGPVSAGIAPSTTPLKADSYTILSEKDVAGRSFTFFVFGIPLFNESSTKKSSERAINRAGADALVDVTVQNNKLYLLFVGVNWITVAGKPVKML